MKKIIERLSLPFFLIVGYLSHILFLFYTEQRIPNIADAIIIGFLSILYGFSMYMSHIKKPDHHKILEDKFIESQKELLNEIAALRAETDKKVTNLKEDTDKKVIEMNGKVGALSIQKGLKSSNPNPAASLGW